MKTPWGHTLALPSLLFSGPLRQLGMSQGHCNVIRYIMSRGNIGMHQKNMLCYLKTPDENPRLSQYYFGIIRMLPTY